MIYLWALHVRSIVVVKLLWGLHWYSLVHVWCAWHRVRHGGAASSLVWRVWELGIHWSTLALKWRSHATTTLIRLVSERWRCRRVSHLLLVLRVETSTSTALWGKAATTLSTWALVAHIALCRLRRFSTKMSGLIAGSQWTLRCRSLSHVTLSNTHN